MVTPSSARSTRATTKFKYTSKREIGQPKTLVTVRLENSLLDQLAKIGNAEKLSMSATVRKVLRSGLGLPAEPSPSTSGPRTTRAKGAGAAGKTASHPANVRPITSAKGRKKK